MSRDALRSRVYAAEQQVTTALSRPGQRIDFFGSQLTPPAEKHFQSLAEVRTYVADVLADHQVVSTWGYAPPIRVRNRAGDSMAHYEYESAKYNTKYTIEVVHRDDGFFLATPIDNKGRRAKNKNCRMSNGLDKVVQSLIQDVLETTPPAELFAASVAQ